MGNWQTKSSEEVYATPWIKVRRDEVENHAGKPLTYSVVELLQPGCFVVALDDKGRIFLQRQYRYTLDMDLWELPAGGDDQGNPLAAAKRELEEETGLVSNDWSKLGELKTAVGIAKIDQYTFLARNAKPSGEIEDGLEEYIESGWFSFEQIKEMIQAGKIIHAETIAALFQAMLLTETALN